MDSSPAVRSAEQAARERAQTQAANALDEIDATTRHVEQYRDAVAGMPGHDDLVALLNTAADRLAQVRKELRQGLYSNADQTRLF